MGVAAAGWGMDGQRLREKVKPDFFFKFKPKVWHQPSNTLYILFKEPVAPECLSSCQSIPNISAFSIENIQQRSWFVTMLCIFTLYVMFVVMVDFV